MCCMQVKILRDPARPDKQGKPSSKGMGFAELTSHEHALCALRELNNNPTTFGPPVFSTLTSCLRPVL